MEKNFTHPGFQKSGGKGYLGRLVDIHQEPLVDSHEPQPQPNLSVAEREKTAEQFQLFEKGSLIKSLQNSWGCLGESVKPSEVKRANHSYTGLIFTIFLFHFTTIQMIRLLEYPVALGAPTSAYSHIIRIVSGVGLMMAEWLSVRTVGTRQLMPWRLGSVLR